MSKVRPQSVHKGETYCELFAFVELEIRGHGGSTKERGVEPGQWAAFGYEASLKGARAKIVAED